MSWLGWVIEDDNEVGVSMNNHIVCTKSNGVLEICLNRPDKKNAITDAMYGDIISAMNDAIGNDEVRVVLFTAIGDFFSAGNDLSDFLAVSSKGGGDELQAWQFIRLLADYPKPIVAAVTGAGVGIGTTLLLHCDLVYVHKDARLTTPFVNLALVPEAASSLLLPQKIGHAKAFEMFVLGEVMTGEMAVDCGLANACFDATHEVVQTARQKAQQVATRPTQAVLYTKSLMRDVAMIIGQMNAEKDCFAKCLLSDDARNIFERFLNKSS